MLQSLLSFALTFLLCIPSTFAHQASFFDVTSNNEYFDAIEYVTDQGIVNGYPDGNFWPNRAINRAEFTKIVMLAGHDPSMINSCRSTMHLRDVSSDIWYAPYICSAQNFNVINGYPDGTFRPDEYINFAEAAKILSSTFGYSGNTTAHDRYWYQPFIRELENRGAIPSTITSFDQPITRSEMAEMIWRLRGNNSIIQTSNYEPTVTQHGWRTRYNPIYDSGFPFSYPYYRNGTNNAYIEYRSTDGNANISIINGQPTIPGGGNAIIIRN